MSGTNIQCKYKLLLLLVIVFLCINLVNGQSKNESIIVKDYIGFEWELNVTCVPTMYEYDSIRHCAVSLYSIPMVPKPNDSVFELTEFEVLLFDLLGLKFNQQINIVKYDTTVKTFSLLGGIDKRGGIFVYEKRFKNIEKMVENFKNIVSLLEKTDYRDKIESYKQGACCVKALGIEYIYLRSGKKNDLHIDISIEFEKLPNIQDVEKDNINYNDLLPFLHVYCYYY